MIELSRARVIALAVGAIVAGAACGGGGGGGGAGEANKGEIVTGSELPT